mmetsp:Transcript_10292/g.32160  ORF Transcript_10292/g.32160 Transcript_10292/m.32160 type:complete len:261 (-) Transcript_10292:53-835(-)
MAHLLARVGASPRQAQGLACGLPCGGHGAARVHEAALHHSRRRAIIAAAIGARRGRTRDHECPRASHRPCDRLIQHVLLLLGERRRIRVPYPLPARHMRGRRGPAGPGRQHDLHLLWQLEEHGDLVVKRATNSAGGEPRDGRPGPRDGGRLRGGGVRPPTARVVEVSGDLRARAREVAVRYRERRLGVGARARYRVPDALDKQGVRHGPRVGVASARAAGASAGPRRGLARTITSPLAGGAALLLLVGADHDHLHHSIAT